MLHDTVLRNVIRLAAAGGAMAVLCGTAAADSAGAVAAPSVQPQKPDAGVSSPLGRRIGQNQSPENLRNSDGQINRSDQTAPAQNVQNSTTAGSPGVQKPGIAPGQNNTVDSTQPGQKAKVGTGNSGSADDSTGTTQLSKSKSTDGTSASNNSDIGAASQEMIPTGLEKPQPVSAPEVPVIRFKSEMLAVQPTIVSRISTPVDLAATVPSTPQHNRQPAPAKSSGALASLPGMLASIVVPQPFWLHGGIVDIAVPVLALATLALLLVNVFVFTYGLWLRRGGYATAARSDEPQGFHLSYLATPLSLGYVWSPRRQHSPIFVVSDKQKYFMAPTLTERRICR